MDPNRFDVTGLPTFALILVIVTAIVYALRRLNKAYPQIAETVKDATPWMEWTELDQDTDTTDHRSPYHDYV